MTARLRRALTTGLAIAALAASAFAAAPARTPDKAVAAAPDAAPGDWRLIDPENVLVIDTTKGRILVELEPQAAPAHVERIKSLTRERFYDGLKFHRVIDYFMAQTGDPLGTGEGQSPYPDLKAEFTFRRDASMAFTPVATPKGSAVGFMGGFPVQTQPDDLMIMTGDHKVWAWGLYCPGVAGMARGEGEDTGNSQFFLMRQTYPSLEKRYTAFGRVVAGLDVVRALKTGEPVVDPDVMTKAQILADLPAGQRPTLAMLDTRSKAFAQIVERTRKAKGADFSICDVEIPVQIR